jgi:hypothetical protein
MIKMLHTMVELILTLSCIRIKTLLCFLYHLLNELAENKMKQPALSDSNVDNREGIKLKGGSFIATTSATSELCENHDAPCYTMMSQDVCILDATLSCMHSAVTNLFQEVNDGMESRMTPIQEREDDEDITTLDTHTPRPSPRYKSSPTQLPRSVRIQPTPLHCFGDTSLIRHRNEAYKDALERGRRRRHFGSGPSSRRFVDHAV